MTAKPPEKPAGGPPLLDLARLFVAIRRRRRLWVACALLGMIGGGLVAVLLPPPPTATTRLLVVHEQDQPSDTGSLIRTDAALLATTSIAAAALERLGSDQPPERFVEEYTVTGLTNNVLEISVEGPTEAEATRRAQALADAFIADHVGRIQAAASAQAKALIEQRDRIQGELNRVNRDINGAEAAIEDTEDAAPANAAALDSLYARRAELTSRISDLTQQAEEAGIGAPQVAANTQIVDAPRPVRTSILMSGATNSVIGLVLGLVAGVALAAVTGVVKDKPVLRKDIAEHLGASVIAQLPAPRRGPSRLWRGGRAARERGRVAATLVRLLRTGPGPVSVLELGSPRVAAALTLDLATGLAADRNVVIVEDPVGRVVADDLPGRRLDQDPERPVRIVGAEDTGASTPDETRLGIGSVAPGTAWTDLTHLGAETILVVRAGFAHTEWLHTVARQLADARIPIIGVVLVDPDPRDRSDGTLWDGLHTALRGRGRTPEPPKVNGTNGTNGTEPSTHRFAPVQPHLRRHEPSVHDLPTKRFAPVERGTKG
ncbi:Wzz/FepE/Etk N-terminal domain-containing protein [Actinophytocola gossypii]|uniref:Polysaccharide biosynthesis protein n=1 Tax=Actinophytocola gossypii TaxID=2812003 RepID=A0ABT2JDY0_9PSEU|nr:Wzz/FepE/Etk N-terminal domain-containing protein [Actinophytocola gossypii]MCT2585739.1 polysaccharide biosynthesis protein [Actinophytocola gossypii]